MKIKDGRKRLTNYIDNIHDQFLALLENFQQPDKMMQSWFAFSVNAFMQIRDNNDLRIMLSDLIKVFLQEIVSMTFMKLGRVP